MKTLAQFFWEMFKISLFVVGGGYAIIVVADDVCAKKKWTKEGELLDSLPIFQMIPGLIATHTAVYVGRKVAGVKGVIAGVSAVALPSIIIFTFVSLCYGAASFDSPVLVSAFTGLRAALVGIISATLVRGWKRPSGDLFFPGIMIATLLGLFIGIEVWAVILLAMAAGLIRSFLQRQRSALSVKSSLLPCLIFLKYGALCFGGGFVLVPMYCEDFVGPSAPFLKIAEEEFGNLMALTQMTPGPIGLNAATYFGISLAGVPGALLASASLLLPGSLMAFFAFHSLEKFKESRIVKGVMAGARPASTALMLFALFVFSGTCLFSADGGINFSSVIIALVSALVIMRRKINMIAISILAALAAAVVHADTTVTAEKYPDADAVIIEETDRVKYNPDGTYVSHSQSLTKILTERGRRREGVISLHYSKRYGEAKIEYVGVISPDGSERAVDIASASKETTDNDSIESNIYDPLDRVIRCNVPGLKIGDVLKVKTVRRALKPRCEGAWGDISVMEWTSPILKSVFEVTAPQALPLRKAVVRNPLGNVVTSKKTLPCGSVVHTFVCTNSPRCFPEPDMPPLYTQVQRVAVSTTESWEELSKWYWHLCESHLAKTNAAMSSLVSSARAECGSSRNDLMRRLFKFVSQEIRYMGLTMEDKSPGYAPHDVDITFNNRYGVCRDKAALLVALLRMAGFNAFPVLIHAGAKMDEEVPQPFFNHAIAAVEDTPGGEYILMDPTNESTVDMFPSYLGDKSYLVARPEGDTLRTSPVPTSAHNSLLINSKCTVSEKGSMFLEAKISCRGINDIAYRHALIRRTPAERRELFERILRAISPNAEVLICDFETADMSDTEKPLVFSIKAILPEAILRGKSETELTIPFLGAKIGIANFLFKDNTSLEKRKYPLVLDSTAGISETVEIALDDATGEALCPKENLASSVDGKYSLVRTVVSKGSRIDASRDLKISAVEFSPSEYDRLLSALKESEKMEKRKTLFNNNKEANADTRTLLHSREITTFSDKVWVVTNKVVKKILTYYGKKESSELMFSYNPSVCSLEIIDAWVSNRNGRVSHVSEKEKNVMDESWVALAPRYSPSKTLIVNLPSVEIGSVVSWTEVRNVTNAPAPFRGEFIFDTKIPTDRISVRVDDWKHERVSPVRIPDEPFQPDAKIWRDTVIIAKGSFDSVRDALRKAVDIEKIYCRKLPGMESSTIESIRNWMAKNVRVAGPGMWALPIDEQLTPCEKVLEERYATRLDYIRTMCALLRGAGYDADIVLSANNAAKEKGLDIKPKLTDFAYPLCRIKERKGSFLGFGGKENVLFIGTEDQYSPIGPSSHQGADFYDPKENTFGMVAVSEEKFKDFNVTKVIFDISADGTVDIENEDIIYGSAVGSFRKRYKEILPEDLKRHYRSLVCDFSQAAVAKGELQFDTEGYPAKRTFALKAKDFAQVSGDTILIELPQLPCSIAQLEDIRRKTPLRVSACDDTEYKYIVKFPPGYTEIEASPGNFDIGPEKNNKKWMKQEVHSDVIDGRLVLTVSRRIYSRECEVYPPTMAGSLFGWKNISQSRASRTVIVRKTRKASK